MKSKKVEKRKGQNSSLVRASISFPRSLYLSLESISKRKKVSLAWVVRDAVEKYVASDVKQSSESERL
jgi:metal-responsive CopG/Arc/MetJ family transcriptional regulator